MPPCHGQPPPRLAAALPAARPGGLRGAGCAAEAHAQQVGASPRGRMEMAMGKMAHFFHGHSWPFMVMISDDLC